MPSAWVLIWSIDHVSFNSLKKFDGKQMRYLRNTEIGQISGRAGRYTNNGTFVLPEVVMHYLMSKLKN